MVKIVEVVLDRVCRSVEEAVIVVAVVEAIAPCLWSFSNQLKIPVLLVAMAYYL